MKDNISEKQYLLDFEIGIYKKKFSVMNKQVDSWHNPYHNIVKQAPRYFVADNGGEKTVYA